jgi:hypothetical protein
MSLSSSLLTRSFLVGVLIVSTTYGASALTVQRGKTLIDGVYVPVLVVRVGDETHVHQIGEDGLTRSIMFDQKRALKWAQELYGADAIEAETVAGSGAAGNDAGDGTGDDGVDTCSGSNC